MQTPFSPPSNRLQSLRLGIAILLTGSVVLLSGTMVVRLYSMIKADEQHRMDQLHQQTLARGNYLKTAQNYNGCIAEAQKVPDGSLFHSQAKTLQDQCQNLLTESVISRAQQMATAGYLKNAIAEVKTISDSDAAAQVQQLVWEWSNRVLQIAYSDYLDPSGKFQNAIRIASAITPDNPLYEEAQARIRSWQQEWLVNQIHWQAAEAALNAHQLETALLHVQQMTHPYWKQQSAVIVNTVYADYAEQAKVVQPDPSTVQKPEDQASQAPELDQSTGEVAQNVASLRSNMLLMVLLPFSLATLLSFGRLQEK